MKKKYLREKKKYVTEEEYEQYHALRKRGADACKGRRPHQWVLVLPIWRAKWDEKHPYDAEAYYKAMMERREFIKKQDAELAKKGILVSPSHDWLHKDYACVVCKKRRTEDI